MRSILTLPRNRRGLLLFAAAVLAVAAMPTTAQEVPSDAVLKDFEPSGDFVFVLDGVQQKNAEVYRSDLAVAYLVISYDLPSPIMVSPRTQMVETVNLMKVVKKDDGSIDILADAVLDQVGPFHLDGKKVVWKMRDGRDARLEERPWLLKRQTGKAIKEYNAEYAHKASLYTPNPSYVTKLRAVGKNVEVLTYFGSWCPHCKEIVPRILRVADELQGSKIGFTYYGLPSPMSEDPEADRAKVHGVPTVVVFIDGKETARLIGGDLTAPEVGLAGVLTGS